MTDDECGRDALALLTLITHGDLDGTYNYIEDMDGRGVDFEHVLVDLAGMAGSAVLHLARLSHVQPDDILQATGATIAEHNEAVRAQQQAATTFVTVVDEVSEENKAFLRENFGIDLDADDDGNEGGDDD